MSKKYEKALLLCTNKYSLYQSFLYTLQAAAETASGFDLRSKINRFDLRLHTQSYRFPFSIRNRWEMYFLSKINRLILDEFYHSKPDLVFVYNSEYLLPESCLEIRKKAKLIFFMGDSPFYTPQNNYYLSCLTYADLILAPDTFWLEQLNVMGIHNTAFFIPSLDNESYFFIIDNEIYKDVENTEVLYTGMSYASSWGYKKALLMNQFSKFNFKLYGNSMWKRWFSYFPELESCFVEAGFIPTSRLNMMFNKTKLIPVDGNPAILNGFHIRLFEALGGGALPLTEYRKDIETLLFKKCGFQVPLIKDYSKASDFATYYLKNENERKELVKAMRDYISNEYNPEKNAERLLEQLASASQIK